MTARERICVTRDGERAVPEGHPEAAFLLVGEGCEIEDAEAERFGIRDGRLRPSRGGKAKRGPEETK
jgi:hypothetical protein